MNVMLSWVEHENSFINSGPDKEGIWASWENRIFANAKNKDTDQLRGNREANQRPCFRYTDITSPLVFRSEISSL